MSNSFLEIITKVEEVTGTQEEFMLGTWLESAKALAKNADDFTKELYELNARGLITTWGSIEQANSGGLIDYSNRQWSGLTSDYYKPRWEKWIAERKKELAGEESKITQQQIGLKWNGRGLGAITNIQRKQTVWIWKSWGQRFLISIL